MAWRWAEGTYGTSVRMIWEYKDFAGSDSTPPRVVDITADGTETCIYCSSSMKPLLSEQEHTYGRGSEFARYFSR